MRTSTDLRPVPAGSGGATVIALTPYLRRRGASRRLVLSTVKRAVAAFALAVMAVAALGGIALVGHYALMRPKIAVPVIIVLAAAALWPVAPRWLGVSPRREG